MQGGFKDIIKIAAPVIVASIAQTSISIADTAMLGHFGTAEQAKIQLAAIGMVSVYYLLLFMIGFAYTKGTQIMVARRVGEGNMEGAGAVFDNSLATIIVLGLSLVLLIKLGSNAALDLLVQNGEVRTAAESFLAIRAYGIIFSLIGSVFLSFYMGIGRVTILAFGVISMSALNILLNWVFIYGNWGSPVMGIKGSALASDIAEAYAAILFLGYTIAIGAQKKYHLFHLSSLSTKISNNIAKLAAPIVAQTLIGLAAWVIFFTFVEKMGTRDTAISGIVKSVYMFFGLFAWGFSTSANTIISTLMGQKKFIQVVRALKNIIFLSFLFQVITSIPLLLFPRQIITIFNGETTLVNEAIPVVYVCVIALLVYSVATTMFHGIVSTGSVNSSLRIEIVTVLLYLVFVFFIFNVSWKTVTIVWFAEVFYWFILGVLTLVYLLSGRWKKTTI